MQLSYRQYGAGAKNLIILHGLLGSSQNWHSVANKFSEQDHVVVPDQRNHGDSPHGPHTVELLSQDIFNLLNQLGIEKTILMGHSMGGLAAMSFAFAHPERLAGLIVVDIVPVAQLNSMNWIFEALKAIDLSTVKRREDANAQLAAHVQSALVRQFLLQNLKRREDGRYAWRCNLDELHRFVQNQNRLQVKQEDTFAGPALFIGGGRSEHRIQEKKDIIQQHFPNYELIMIPDAGHWVHFEAMNEFMDVATSFILAN